VVSGGGVGLPARRGFTHSRTPNDDDDNDNVIVVVFAVVDGRGAWGWRAGGPGGGPW
jgi:hypothetical protein